jgi:hypothetical protein
VSLQNINKGRKGNVMLNNNNKTTAIWRKGMLDMPKDTLKTVVRQSLK